MSRLIIPLVLVSILFLGCTASSELISKKEIHDDIEMLYGQTSKKQLFFDYPEWKIEYDSYIIKETYIDSLKKIIDDDISIMIFFATWCSDSEREVPRFLKILDDSEVLSNDKMTLYALDRIKKMENNLPEKYNISRVATFIIFKEGNEIGRIVESPAMSLEADLLNILLNRLQR